jgi:positive regulator of sigma E activity
LSALLQQGKGRVRALSGDTLQASSCQLGDEVLIEIPDSTLLGGTLWLYGAPLLLGTGLSLWAASWGDLWAASAFCLGLLSGFAILHQLSRRFQGRLPGMAEPRLASKTAPPHFELLAKQ